MPQEIGQPLAVLDIGFASRHRLDVLRIDQDERTPLLQQVEHRSPIHPSRLEGDHPDLQGVQPIVQC
jgi:hypothetical protein